MYSILYQCLVFIISANIKHTTDKLENCDSSAGKVTFYLMGNPWTFIFAIPNTEVQFYRIPRYKVV